MNSLHFWLNGLLTIIDIKQFIFMGSQKSNSFVGNEVDSNRRSFRSFDDLLYVKSFTNPLIPINTPDPGVTRLADGSGWAAVATSNHASKSGNNSAFPMFFSEGNTSFLLLQFY